MHNITIFLILIYYFFAIIVIIVIIIFFFNQLFILIQEVLDKTKKENYSIWIV